MLLLQSTAAPPPSSTTSGGPQLLDDLFSSSSVAAPSSTQQPRSASALSGGALDDDDFNPRGAPDNANADAFGNFAAKVRQFYNILRKTLLKVRSGKDWYNSKGTLYFVGHEFGRILTLKIRIPVFEFPYSLLALSNGNGWSNRTEYGFLRTTYILLFYS